MIWHSRSELEEEGPPTRKELLWANGVQRWLLAERLRASLQSIVRSSGSHKIGSIARAQSFRSEAHFSRSFLKQYQLSPSSVRDLARDASGLALYEQLLEQGGRKWWRHS